MTSRRRAFLGLDKGTEIAAVAQLRGRWLEKGSIPLSTSPKNWLHHFGLYPLNAALLLLLDPLANSRSTINVPAAATCSPPHVTYLGFFFRTPFN
jgi:hypothetical protein